MGCQCDKQIPNLDEKNKYFAAYKSLKSNLDSMKKSQIIIFEGYLISTKTIPKFMKIIKSSKILETNNLNINQSYNYEENLKDLFQNYELEKNIEIYYEYDKCNKIAEDNNNLENEFIIVDEYFINYMDINYLNIISMKVSVKVNKMEKR